MALQDTDISKVRTILLGLTGLSCLLYAILAVTQNTPQPIWWFVPTVMGCLLESVPLSLSQWQTQPRAAWQRMRCTS